MTYSELASHMTGLSDAELLRELDNTSIKVGDTAASILGDREFASLVSSALRSRMIRTKLGKIRATNLLARRKKNTGAELDALAFLLHDKVTAVAYNALFAIVKTGGLEAKNLLLQIENSLSLNPELKADTQRAVLAIEKGDPRIFSPNFGG